MEKEVVIRRRIAKMCVQQLDASKTPNDDQSYASFNKTQEDFPDLSTYNNYLEEVEDFSELLPACRDIIND